MNETEATLKLIIIVGLIFSIPFFWRTCFTLGQLFIIKFFPPKFITLEVKLENGDVEIQKVNLSDENALTKYLLMSTGRSV